jgi:alpha-beta hydrolase superfamily lysophospholipase
MALFDPPIDLIGIPFEDKQLPAYFFTPDVINRKRKTLIMIGGGDTFVEDLYYYICPAGLRRDYNILIVDLPGQGSLPFDGLPMRAAAEEPMKAVVDYILSRPEVDPSRLAAFGISGGGYLVPRAVTREKRIQACIACSVILDFHQHFARLTQIEKIARLEGSMLFKIFLKVQQRKTAAAFRLIDTYLWRWGVENVAGFMDVLRKFTFDPADITCPILIVVGESEYQWPWSRYCQEHALERVNAERKIMVITPENEGAEGHAIGTNLSLISQVVFDWLDEVFAVS